MKLTHVVVGLASLALLGGCAKSATTNTSTTTNQATSTSSGSTAVGENGVTVSLSEYAISPSALTLKAGVTNTITVKNEGSLSHTYTANDLGINVTVPAGGAETVTVAAPKAGSYTVRCTMPGHEALGMKGTITVQ
ncbi:MAG: cupredoxin domain-containing protein [Candidatus Andersenbacteria bacterium]